MGLYALGSECRVNASLALKTSDVETHGLWARRLEDIGVRVAGALVEMGELEAAGRHLEGLEARGVSAGGSGREDAIAAEEDTMAARKALLYLRIGDVDRARSCIASSSSSASSSASASARSRIISALIDAPAPPSSESGAEENDILTHNTALANLYKGNISLALETLESLVGKGGRWPGLVMNLATVYELCSERAREKKESLLGKVAGMAPPGQQDDAAGVWELGNVVFKL